MSNTNHPAPHEPSGNSGPATLATLTPHEPAADATIVAFSAWLDKQLEALESTYRQNWTHQSVKKAFGR